MATSYPVADKMGRWVFMIKKGILLIFSLCSLVHASPIQDRKIESAALWELALELGIPPGANLIEETQKRWLRKPTQERWELNEISPKQRRFVLDWAKEQGIFSAWQPSRRVYDKALILGATTSRMQMRLDFLKQIWMEGVRFTEIVWLTGDRPLDKSIDGLMDLCQTESEAAQILWEEADLPKEMRALSVVFVAIPMRADGKRPNTEDTIVGWVKVSPEPCTALFISDQPFCGYQFAVVKGALPEEFLFDLAGQGVDPSSHPAAAAITLDCIARWIYQDSINAWKVFQQNRRDREDHASPLQSGHKFWRPAFPTDPPALRTGP